MVNLFTQAPGVIISGKVSIVTIPPHPSEAVAKAGLDNGTKFVQLTITGAGGVIIGGFTSLTVIICVAVAVLKQTSVALYVLVIVYLLAQEPGVIISGKVSIVTIPPHPSEAVAEAGLDNGTKIAQLTITGTGGVIIGGFTSLTVIICVAVAVLKQTSVALYVLVMVYLLAQEPGVIISGKVSIVTIPPHPSEAVANAGLDNGTKLAQLTITGTGAVIIGGFTSLTVIICVAVAVLPQTSVALYVLVMVYLLAQEPGVIISGKVSIVTIPPHPSEADAKAGLDNGTKLAQLTITGTGAVIIGGVISFTVIT